MKLVKGNETAYIHKISTINKKYDCFSATHFKKTPGEDRAILLICNRLHNWLHCIKPGVDYETQNTETYHEIVISTQKLM
jgi:hypothetical protein